jgi:hypothetical protein
VAHLATSTARVPSCCGDIHLLYFFPVSLLWAERFVWLAVAFIVRDLKEFGEPAHKAFVIAQAPSQLRGRTYGAF